jgi:molecular chaperone HscA
VSAGQAIGIDLGTTHSLVAFVDERGRPQLVELEAQDEDAAGAEAAGEGGGRGPLLPSAVHYREDGGVLVGRAARRLAGELPADTVLSAKRLIGLGPGDLRPEDRGIYRFEEGGHVVRLRVAGGRRAVTPVEVSAEILRDLRRRAAAALGGPPGGCVLTVPAWFDDAQRQATRDAGRIAGLEVLRLLPEPTAAALAYGLDRRVRGHFAVYDLGGGTFDLSILRLSDGLFEVLATCGDTRLGGDDMDRAVAAWLLARSGDGAGAGAPDPSPAELRGARELGRAARELLSSRDEVEVDATLAGGRRLEARLGRATLEALLLPVVERTVAPCRQALRDAGLEGPLDGVVLVGGTTRMPLVRRVVREIFGQEPLHDVDPDTAVALGAAIQADALTRGGRDDVLLVDVVPLSLGVEMLGGMVERIVPRNSAIPARATQDFTTHADGQTGLSVHVVQGERELARDCRSLARFTLRGIPPLPAGAARVRVTYEVDADGILAVSARELCTGAEQRIEVRATAGLSEAEVERMLVESLEHAGEDVAARVLAEWQVEGERALQALSSALREDGGLLAAGEREEIELRMMGLREAVGGDDAAAIQAWVSSLDEASRAFAERRMDLHLGRAVRGRRVDDL